ncbi:hypothetical protein N7456_004741 [Penicillium angulare]|uniref:Uncharacterized protein n=1 Tax=Penicillium angulare TaxID=116970 RepID=A0A9W9FX85_9EURO|nr:hypothetical protein N7456_004741 [Penicillium angulare]
MSDQPDSKAAKYHKLDRKLRKRQNRLEKTYLLSGTLSEEIKRLERRLKKLPVPSSISSETNTTGSDAVSCFSGVSFDDSSSEGYEFLSHSDTESEKPPARDCHDPIPVSDSRNSKILDKSLAELNDIDHYPPPGIYFERLVSWQKERHIQWAGDYDGWGSKEIYTTLDIRTASELKLGAPYGKGNTELNAKKCEYDRLGFKWGLPAAALRKAFLDDPEKWMLLDEPRAYLVVMENWYFSLTAEERKKLPPSAWGWDDLPEAHNGKWNRAFIS